MRTLREAPANPGASATVSLFDTGALPWPGVPNPTENQRIRAAFYTDQIVTINQYWYPPGGATKRLASTTATVANTFKAVDLPMYPGRNSIELVTTTAPTVWDVGIEVLDQSS